MATISYEQLRSTDGRKIKEIDVPELGGSLRARMLSGTDFFRITEYSKENPNDLQAWARLLFQYCFIDENNEPLFADMDAVDVLMGQPSELILRISQELQEFCGLSAVKDEDAVKNSEPTPD